MDLEAFKLRHRDVLDSCHESMPNPMTICIETNALGTYEATLEIS